MSERYTTRQDAIEQAIVPALGDFGTDYDLDAIFDACFEYDPCEGHIQDAGYVQVVDDADFWQAVEAADKTAS